MLTSRSLLCRHPIAPWPVNKRDLKISTTHERVEPGTRWLAIHVLLSLVFTLVSCPFSRMQPEFDGDPRPGSSLTVESSTTAHSTATHKHKSPMRRLMNGLKRLNSYSNDQSDSSSSEDEETRVGSGDGQGGSEEFVERHRVQEIRFNYESLSPHSPSCQTCQTLTHAQTYELESSSS